MQIGRSHIWRSAVHGVLFAPLFKERTATATDARADENRTADDAAGNDAHSHADPHDMMRSIWQTIADHSRHVHGRRVGFSFSTTAAWTMTALVGLWIAGTMLSGVANRSTIAESMTTASQLVSAHEPTRSALTLNALQAQLDTLEFREHNGAPWHTRFGLNHDAALFAAPGRPTKAEPPASS